MNPKRRNAVLVFAISIISGLMSNVVANYVAPAFQERQWLALGIFAISLLVGLWLALRQDGSGWRFKARSPVTPSPYIVGCPVELDGFFGRRKQVERFFAVIGSEKQIQSVSLLGLRRSGKTSFLRYVSAPSVLRTYLPQPNKYMLIFVDLQTEADTPTAFYRKVIGALTFTAGIPSPLSHSEEPQFRHLRSTLDAIAPHRVAILLDEFDRLTTFSAFDDAFFTGLRSLVTGRQLAWVTTSYRNLHELGRRLNVPQTSPFFNIFNTSIFLGPFTADEADDLIAQPALSAGQPFSTDDVIWLKSLAGQLPAFLQKASQALFESRAHSPNSATARKIAKREFTHWAEHHFTYYWDNLDDAERDILSRLATTDNRARSSLPQIRQEFDTIEDFTDYGLVVEGDYGYHINGTALADWICNKRPKSVTTQPTAFIQSASSPSLATSSSSSSTPNIHPGGILIITATKIEAQAVLEAFSQATGRRWSRQPIENKTYYSLGTHGSAPVFMVQSEIGTSTPGGALVTVRQAIQDLRPQAVIMCGIAFGLRSDKQQLGDILVTKQLLCYEPQKIDIQRGQMPRGDRITVAERLLDRFRSGDNDWQGAQTHFGLVLSGEKLVNDPAFREWLLKTEPEAVGGEMEGAGLYVAARDAKVDWILVKGICDWADGNKNDDAQPLAARNAAQFVLHVLQLGGWGRTKQLSRSRKSRTPRVST
jgi:nucleoside phosphorylase